MFGCFARCSFDDDVPVAINTRPRKRKFNSNRESAGVPSTALVVAASTALVVAASSHPMDVVAPMRDLTLANID